MRSQVAALEAQLLSMRDALAALPPQQQAIAAAHIDHLHAVLAELRPLVNDAPAVPAEGQPDGEVLVWTAERATRLYALNTSLTVTLSQSQAAQLVVSQALPALDAAGCVVLTVNGDKLMVVGTSDEDAGSPAWSGLENASPFSEAAQRVQSVWIQNPVELRSRFPSWTGTSWGRSGALAVVPLIAQSRVTGVIGFRFDVPRSFPVADRAFILVLAQQCAAAFERVQLYEQVRRAAALEERNRLARDLHDSVSQALYGIVLAATVGTRSLAEDPDTKNLNRARRALENIHSLVGLAQADLRALLFDMRADAVADAGLVRSLEERAKFMRQRHGLTVHAELCEEPQLPAACKEALYGIAREALHNAAKHARANEVHLRLQASTEGLVLEISDDGLGFEPASVRHGHYGLQSMRERAAELGATLQIESASGKGTRVLALLSRYPGGDGDYSTPCA